MPCKCGNPVTIFLSTPSARRATIPAITSASSSGISIHALREEGDCYSSVEGR